MNNPIISIIFAVLLLFVLLRVFYTCSRVKNNATRIDDLMKIASKYSLKFEERIEFPLDSEQQAEAKGYVIAITKKNILTGIINGHNVSMHDSILKVDNNNIHMSSLFGIKGTFQRINYKTYVEIDNQHRYFWVQPSILLAHRRYPVLLPPACIDEICSDLAVGKHINLETINATFLAGRVMSIE